LRATRDRGPVRIAGSKVVSVTAKERLRRMVSRMSESEATAALARLEANAAETGDEQHNPVMEMLDNAPPEDEEISPEEEAAVAEALEEHRRGKSFSSSEIKRELL
jgi:hypothetical protein